MRKTKYPRLSGIFFLVIFFCGFSSSSIAQGMLVKSSTNLKVISGTMIVETGEFNMESGASVDNSGTIILMGNLVNQSPTQSNLGSGTIEFAGTTEQTISGQNLIGNLTVSKASGRLVIGGNTQVNGHLTLTSGRVSLGPNNLLLGPSADVIGTITAANMVVAIGTGELRKSWSGNGSFIFPVGDTTSTAEYSPVTLNFTSGTYPANNYIGVSLKNLAYNTTLYTGSYLNRYWAVTNTSGAPITGFSCDAQFNYVSADVSGIESELYCTKVAPDPVVTYAATDATNNILTAAGLTSFSTFTGTKGGLAISLNAMLEGPYNTTNHNMNTTINSLIPSSQPYSGTPWNYAGTESFTPPVGATVVDWVLVELRQAATPGAATTYFARQAGLLLNNGSIVDKSGSGSLKFYNVAVSTGNNLYPVVYHRNHMPTMANNGVTVNGDGSLAYNFTTSSGQIYGTGKVQLEPTVWGMLAGDGDNDMQIGNTDFDLWGVQFGGVSYLKGDFDMDHQVGNTDYDKWAVNFGKIGSLP